MAAIDAALSGQYSPDDVSDVATRLNVSTKDGGKQYGGLYGGKKSKASAKKRIPAKKVVERFTESDPRPDTKKIVPASHVDLDSLGDAARKIYEAMLPAVPVVADDIPVTGIGMGELMAGLTMLELAGVVECGAGGYYLRRSSDGPSIHDGDEE